MHRDDEQGAKHSFNWGRMWKKPLNKKWKLGLLRLLNYLLLVTVQLEINFSHLRAVLKSWIAFKIAILLPFFHSISNMQLDLGLFSPNPSWSLIVTWVLPLTPRTFQELPRLKKSASFSVFFISVRRFASQSVAIWSLRSQNCSQNSNNQPYLAIASYAVVLGGITVISWYHLCLSTLPARFELAAHCLEGSCSIQLS